MPRDQVFELRIKVGDIWGHEDALDAARLMQTVMNMIAGGEDEIPVLAISCMRVDAAAAGPAPEIVEARIVARIRELQDYRSLADASTDATDPAYTDGWNDALRAAMTDSDVERLDR